MNHARIDIKAPHPYYLNMNNSDLYNQFHSLDPIFQAVIRRASSLSTICSATLSTPQDTKAKLQELEAEGLVYQPLPGVWTPSPEFQPLAEFIQKLRSRLAQLAKADNTPSITQVEYLEKLKQLGAEFTSEQAHEAGVGATPSGATIILRNLLQKGAVSGGAAPGTWRLLSRGDAPSEYIPKARAAKSSRGRGRPATRRALIMEQLTKGEALTTVEVATYQGIKRTTAHKILARMEEEGMIDRRVEQNGKFPSNYWYISQ